MRDFVTSTARPRSSGLSQQFALATAAAVLASCIPGMMSGCRDRGPDVQLVVGTVTLDGEPVDKAFVAFTPLDSHGISATGMTRDDGGFVLNATVGKRFGEGTVSGEYVVTIRKLVDPPGGGEPLLVTPRKYSDTKTSPLRAVVTSGRNTLDMALSSKE